MWTLYTASGDVVLLNAIFNGVAMIANNIALVWGFALFASALLTSRASAAAAIETHRGGSGPVLTKGAYHMIAPLVIAMLFTSSDMKVDLTIENTTTGVTSEVDHVPVIIAAIPVGGSAMANAIGPVITTAMSGVNPVYGDITVSGHGFIDPMRRLLAARGAIEHLGAADSELRIVLGKCISLDAGTDFTALNNKVMNAGNTGASAAESIPINGANPTGVGALLYQAAQNTTGLVPQLQIGNAVILNCADAAQLVASDLTNALNSIEFQRVVQGAVNGLDQPLPGADYSVNQIQNEYNAMRNWKSISNTIAVAQSQANAEMINFLFDEEVSNSLNCAQASESNKTMCEATMIQATELERNNLQAAANEVPMLEYSGSFGNYILALIIGLGPVIIMFMMLFGVDSGRCIKTAMHILVWPLLVTNVGAELVNAMLTMQFSNFMTSISQGGFLSPAAIHSAYKELSLQVGVGSHIMASLPVLMSMIFALGEAAGLASVAAEVNPKGNETGKAETPSPVESAPLMRSTSPTTLTQGNGWHSVEQAGFVGAASGSAAVGNITRSATNSVSDAESREKRESQEMAQVRRVSEALANRKYGDVGLNWTQGEGIRNLLENNMREGETDTAQTVAANDRSNQKSSELSATFGYSGGLGVGIRGGAAKPTGPQGQEGGNAGARKPARMSGGLNASANLSAGMSDRANASANDRQSLAENVSRASDVNVAKALSKTLSSDAAKQILEGSGEGNSKALSKELSSADSYLQSVTDRQDHTSAKAQALQATEGFVQATQSIRAPEIAQHAQSNQDFRQFQISEGNKFDALPGAGQHLARAQQDMDSGSTEDVGGDPRSRSAVLRHMAASSMARDTSLPEAPRFEAMKYLVGETNAMLHGNFAAPEQGAFKSNAKEIPLPKNMTGFSAGGLRSQVGHATQAADGLTSPAERVDPKAKGEVSSLHGAPKGATEMFLPGFRTPDGIAISDAVNGGFKDARDSGLAAGEESKSIGVRSFETWFHPSMSGAPAPVNTLPTFPNDEPEGKK